MALNDPQWGRRRGEGPPDLDEIWSRFNQKLAGLFGGKRSGGGGPSEGGNPIGGGAGILVGLQAASIS
jgi:membrane protease subunit HflK